MKEQVRECDHCSSFRLCVVYPVWLIELIPMYLQALALNYVARCRFFFSVVVFGDQ